MQIIVALLGEITSYVFDEMVSLIYEYCKEIFAVCQTFLSTFILLLSFKLSFILSLNFMDECDPGWLNSGIGLCQVIIGRQQRSSVVPR